MPLKVVRDTVDDHLAELAARRGQSLFTSSSGHLSVPLIAGASGKKMEETLSNAGTQDGEAFEATFSKTAG